VSLAWAMLVSLSFLIDLADEGQKHPRVRQHPHSLILIPTLTLSGLIETIICAAMAPLHQSKAKQSVQPLTTSTSHIQKPNLSLPVAEMKEESQTTTSSTPQISQHEAFPPACRLTLGLGSRLRERGSEVPFEPSKPQAGPQCNSQEKQPRKLRAGAVCVVSLHTRRARTYGPEVPSRCRWQVAVGSPGCFERVHCCARGNDSAAVGYVVEFTGGYWNSDQGMFVAASRERQYGEGPRSGGKEFKGCKWPLSALGERDWMAPANMPSRCKHRVQD
jgi:hypothetical protein